MCRIIWIFLGIRFILISENVLAHTHTHTHTHTHAHTHMPHTRVHARTCICTHIFLFDCKLVSKCRPVIKRCPGFLLYILIFLLLALGHIFESHGGTQLRHIMQFVKNMHCINIFCYSSKGFPPNHTKLYISGKHIFWGLQICKVWMDTRGGSNFVQGEKKKYST